jgi:hypothetical protein
MKDEFIGKMITERGREIAAERQQRNRGICAQLQEELGAFELNAAYGMLGCVRYLMTDAEDPSLHRHARGLREQWLAEREQALTDERAHDRDAAAESLQRARGFIELLEGEIEGRH